MLSEKEREPVSINFFKTNVAFHMKTVISLFVILFAINTVVHAQMERKRADPDGPVEGTFWAPNIVGMGTTEQLSANNMNVTIMHSFGIATNQPVKNFFGMDIPPNVRLGLDYGITDSWSLGIGRTTFDKVVDIRTKLALLRQTKTSSVPVSLSMKADVGLTTQENGRPVGDDLNYFVSVIAARKFGNQLSVQAAPMYAHFTTAFLPQSGVNNLFAIGLGAEYHLTDRYAVSAEYYPVIGERNEGTNNAFALALNIETGGHVFQLFLASANWHTEQYILARNNDEFWAGDFRFGFNVNRLFFLGRN